MGTLPPFPPLTTGLVATLFLTAGYRPAHEFVIEWSLCGHQFGNSN